MTSGGKTFSVVAKDSRGRVSASRTAGSITVYAYSDPVVTGLSAQRNPENAREIVVHANWNYASVNGKNYSTATLYYKKSTSTGWTVYGEISKNTDVILSADFAEESSYNFRLVVIDAVGRSAQEEAFIPTINALLDFRAGGKGLGIGKVAESDAMEVALDAKFLGGIYICDGNGSEITLRDYIKSVVSS